MNRFFFLLSVFVFFQANSWGQTQINFDTLEELVEQKQEVKGLKAQSAELSDRPSRLALSYLPELSLETGVESFNRPSIVKGTQPHFLISSKMNLYRGGADQIQQEKQKLEARELTSQTKNYEKKLLNNATQALATYLLETQKEKILTTMLEKIQKQIQRNKKTLQAGQSTKTDLLDFEIKVEEVQIDINDVKMKKKQALEQLAVYLPKESLSNPIFPKSLKAQYESLEQLDLKDIDESSYLDILEVQQELSTIDWRTQQKSAHPKIDLYASWGQETQLHEEDFDSADKRRHQVVGVALTFELDKLFSNKDKVASLKAMSLQKEVNSRLAQKEQRQKLRSSFQELQRLKDKLIKYEKMVSQTKSYEQAIVEEYQRGVQSSSDVVRALERSAKTEITWLNAQRDFISLKQFVFR